MTIYGCCKYMFQVFHVFQTYAVNVSSKCFKSRSWCCTCCNGYTTCFKCFIYFQTMLQLFYLDVLKVDLVLHVFFYSGVVHVAMAPVVGVTTVFLARRASPSSPFPFLPSLPFPCLHLLAATVRARRENHTRLVGRRS
jgi:hypothetical protein